MNELLAIFIFFFAVIDPIGTVPVFIAVTRGEDDKFKRKVILKAVGVSAIVLLFFVVAGELLLNAIEIPLSAFQIAGGIVLLLFALSMIFGESKPETEIKSVRDSTETAIFPLAIPSIASPGAMLGAVLMTRNEEFTWIEQLMTSSMMLAVLALVLILLLLATHVHKVIGDSGASIISRIMGLILSSVAVTNILNGIAHYFGLQVYS
ncbi:MULTISPECIES: MarC family protein [unclassified Pseudoalteromonas]|uniref:MarC family protein n=1 Tax=unclassified Pseudoalteromonas TaxID=194690 RepID=UPI001108CB2E|nr:MULTISPECIES: MarC family protein [unclassified Pseudoalteromonas]TMN84947.1 MarC family transcriptional regulator [Pseudoalteromonas sp. S410]TMN88484.1 MarC family transcriptional regulator [Pseudoalteromonas sp. S408]TMN96822.1 MarC family transcriptional regulator [Pseudoalteromonas sp. S407]TMN98535.1 MarC family transcriptional regulator [Pseudoalteromonas sp. S409]TMO11516.1 MarC family transcriptional regulator [Pseudoalteromonas sp. S186]